MISFSPDYSINPHSLTNALQKNLTLSQQLEVCKRFNADYFESPEHLKVGISLNVKDGHCPIHGLRHPPEGDTTGWYIWAGDYSEAEDFFVPLHVSHLQDWCPEILKYLGLPPGFRFLIAPGYEDIWEDSSLLLP